MYINIYILCRYIEGICTVSLGGGVYCQDLSKGCFAIQDFLWTSLNLMYIVCMHSFAHTDIHRNSENINQTHTGYHPHKCKASTYVVADMHGYKIEGKGAFLSDRILT